MPLRRDKTSGTVSPSVGRVRQYRRGLPTGLGYLDYGLIREGDPGLRLDEPRISSGLLRPPCYREAETKEALHEHENESHLIQ